MHRSRRHRIAKMVFLALPAFLVLFAGLVWGLQALWNGLMPEIFGLKTITYWQALGLMVLSWILFRGFRGPRASRWNWEHGMRRRWEKMTPAEREEFLKGLRTRWGGSPAPETEAGPEA